MQKSDWIGNVLFCGPLAMFLPISMFRLSVCALVWAAPIVSPSRLPAGRSGQKEWWERALTKLARRNASQMVGRIVRRNSGNGSTKSLGTANCQIISEKCVNNFVKMFRKISSSISSYISSNIRRMACEFSSNGLWNFVESRPKFRRITFAFEISSNHLWNVVDLLLKLRRITFGISSWHRWGQPGKHWTNSIQ